MSSMSSVASDLRDLAAWTDRAARWLEQNARRPNDDADPTQRTISFDAAMLDDFLTGFRGVPGIVEALAEQIDQRPHVRVIAGRRQTRNEEPGRSDPAGSQLSSDAQAQAAAVPV